MQSGFFSKVGKVSATAQALSKEIRDIVKEQSSTYDCSSEDAFYISNSTASACKGVFERAVNNQYLSVDDLAHVVLTLLTCEQWFLISERSYFSSNPLLESAIDKAYKINQELDIQVNREIAEYRKNKIELEEKARKESAQEKPSDASDPSSKDSQTLSPTAESVRPSM